MNAKQRKKILIITPWFPSEESSLEGIFVYRQAQALSKLYDVLVIHLDAVVWRDIIKLKRLNKLGFSQTKLEGFNLARYVIINPLPTYFGFSIALRACEKVFTKILKTWGKPDIIHAHVMMPAGWVANQIGKKYKIPVVVTEHSNSFKKECIKPYHLASVKSTLRQVNYSIPVSLFLSEKIFDIEPQSQVKVIGNIIDTNFFHPDIQHQSNPIIKKFLHISLLDKVKGVKDIITAAHILIQKGYQQFEIFIGGDGTERKKLEKQAEDLGIASHINFLGLLSPDEVKYWMQQCDIFIISSLEETFCCVGAEVMACGKPVISTRCGGPEWFVTEETGILVEPANSNDLAQSMEKFMLGDYKFNPDLIRQKIVDMFSENTFIEEISSIYDNLLS